MAKDNSFEVHTIPFDAEDELEVPEFQVDGESEDAMNFGCNESHIDYKVSGEKRTTGFASLVTAIRIAKWVARANGFTSKNKSLYVSQDKVIEKRFV
jgi:hypothetical protein